MNVARRSSFSLRQVIVLGSSPSRWFSSPKLCYSQVHSPPVPGLGQQSPHDPLLPVYFSPGRPGQFSVPNLHSPTSWSRITSHTIKVVNQLKDRIISHPLNPEKRPPQDHSIKTQASELLSLFDTLSNALCVTIDPATAAAHLHPSPAFSKAAQETVSTISGLIHFLNANQEVYASLAHLYELYASNKYPSLILTDEEIQLLTLFLKDFQPYAAFDSPRTRQKILKLHKRIDTASATFMKDCKSNYKDMMRQEESVQTLRQLLRARSELAAVLGAQSYAHLVWGQARLPRIKSSTFQKVERKDGTLRKLRSLRLMKGVEEVDRLLDELADGCRQQALKELKARELSRERRMSRSPTTFVAEEVMNRLILLMQHTFGLSVHRANLSSDEKWAPSVRKYHIFDAAERRGDVYIDLGSREGKYPGSAHFCVRGACQDKLRMTGQRQLPCVIVTLGETFVGQPRVRGRINTNRGYYGEDNDWLWTEAKMSAAQVTSLWHEWAHALHSVLSKGSFQHLSGTRVEVDFVEVPSVLFEYLARSAGLGGLSDNLRPRLTACKENKKWNGHGLRTSRTWSDTTRVNSPMNDISLKYLHGLDLDGRAPDRMGWGEHRYPAVNALEQIAYAKIDLALHRKSFPDEYLNIERIVEQVYSDLGSLPHKEGVGRSVASGFEHLVGYGAGYYGYLVANVVAAQIWRDVFKRDAWNKEAGHKFKRVLLENGAVKPPRDIVHELLEADFCTGAFLEEISPLQNGA